MEKSQETNVESLPVPHILSVEWSDYVMTLFHESELIDGYPTVAGLRRVAELVLGRIISSKPSMVFPIQGDGLGRATVVYEVVFDTENGSVLYSDVADSWVGNTDDDFVAFAVAVAATRAEGRALRKAIKLKKVAAEELAQKPARATEETNRDTITPNQVNFIDRKCKALNINAVLFINAGERKYTSINQVLTDTASKMIKELNRLDNDRNMIPNEIKGYVGDWQSNFKG